MKINAYGYQLKLKSFIKLFFLRIFCTHKTAKFHACTGADYVGNGNNIRVGVSFVCPKCHRTWTADIKACAPSKFKNKDNEIDEVKALKIMANMPPGGY